MHLVIYFCGTGNPAISFKTHYDYINTDQVKTLLVNGCDTKEVCDSVPFPDLKAFSKRFVATTFKTENTLLRPRTDDQKALESVGVNFNPTFKYGDKEITCRFVSDTVGSDTLIESITLCGYSRGAVTCFEVARELNRIAPHIPVDIVADQPVPGNCYQGPGTNAGSIADCRDLKNVKNVSVILGAYTGNVAKIHLHVKPEMPTDLTPYKKSYLFVNPVLYYVNNKGEHITVDHDANKLLENMSEEDISPTEDKKYSLSTSFLRLIHAEYYPEAMHEDQVLIHRGFFSQIVPKLPRATHQEHIIIPHESHHQGRYNAPDGEEHMHMQVAKFLSKKENGKLILEGKLEEKIESAKSTYSLYDIPANLFPPITQLQSFFGLKREEAYRYLDKLHPKAHLRKGMEWNDGQSLIDWWKHHDKKTSLISSKLTKDLVENIKKLQPDNKDNLIALFNQADLWLMAKETTSTTRYYLVEALRNNIFERLIEKTLATKQELSKHNRENLHKTGYFLKHWSQGSNDASWFKTEETRTLDRAFLDHSKVQPSQDEDEKLLTALETWIAAKKDTQSKRFDLVVEIYKHLSNVIKSNYKNSEELGTGSENSEELHVDLYL